MQASCGGEHRVQFYDDPDFLADRVAAFLAGILAGDGAALAIARDAHLAAIVVALRARGLEVEALRAGGRLVIAGARETLEAVLVGGMPDRERFRRTIEELIARAPAGVRIHAFGEMVDLLWDEGQREAAIALEQLWTELVDEQDLGLLCGYRLAAFRDDATPAAFEAVCGCHDEIEPFEPAAAGVVASHALAALERRTAAVESEADRRSRVEQRMERLVAVTWQLAAARRREDVAGLAVHELAEGVGAATAAMWEIVPGAARLRLLTASEVVREGAARYVEIDLEAERDTPIAHVVRTGEPLFLGSLDEYRAQFPRSFERVTELLPPHTGAMALLPIAADGEPVGAICLTYDHARTFTPADRAFKLVLARQSALAIERIQLHERDRRLREQAERAAAFEARARAEVELLYDLTAGVNRLEDLDAIFELALATVLRGSRADRAAILLFDAEGVMRFEASRGLSPTYRAAAEGHSPWRPEDIDAVPIAVADTETDPAWASYREVFRAEGIRALAFVPLVHQRRLIGKFMLYRDQPCPFEPAELQLTATVAVHVALAVERKRAEREVARAYREERAAHLEAEEATRAREEILSVVSHDLRNPLGTIMMGASSLLHASGDDKRQRTRTIAERIHRQAERMARLIEDLVDFAGIQAGRLALSPSPHAPAEILTAASEIYGPLAQERGLRFQTVLAPGLPRITCDSERALQVIGNLVANALKVTPRGGEVAIGAAHEAADVVFFVRDTGPGIDRDELPLLFERHWRSKNAQYKGAGLGLSIARGIVDAHGGRIWAESTPGAGSTFYFSLASGRG